MLLNTYKHHHSKTKGLLRAKAYFIELNKATRKVCSMSNSQKKTPTSNFKHYTNTKNMDAVNTDFLGPSQFRQFPTF